MEVTKKRAFALTNSGYRLAIPLLPLSLNFLLMACMSVLFIVAVVEYRMQITSVKLRHITGSIYQLPISNQTINQTNRDQIKRNTSVEQIIPGTKDHKQQYLNGAVGSEQRQVETLTTAPLFEKEQEQSKTIGGASFIYYNGPIARTAESRLKLDRFLERGPERQVRSERLPKVTSTGSKLYEEEISEFSPSFITEPSTSSHNPGVSSTATPQKVESSNQQPVITTIPILVIACNRPTVAKHLQQLLAYRSASPISNFRFPIIVSQDCNHKKTREAILSFGNKITLIEQPDQSVIKLKGAEYKSLGYYKIARHYKWALNQIFLNYSVAIITEDDLNIAPDFFEYFAATYPLLVNDKTLYCISAWNDNGKPSLIFWNQAELLHRTDFFPGLGWMFTRDRWLEIADRFPNKTWDDWMRQPEQRKDRACIRPEISRTTTFGRSGVSRGQFYENYLRYMKLNSKFVPFTKLDLSHLEKKRYDAELEERVSVAFPITKSEFYYTMVPANASELRLTYPTTRDFGRYARAIGAMYDIRSGVMRTAYNGVISIVWMGHRLYLTPPYPWTGYDDTLNS